MRNVFIFVTSFGQDDNEISLRNNLLIKQAYFSSAWWIINHKTLKKLFFVHLTQKNAEDC